VAEIYAPFSNMEIAAAEALGFCHKGQGAAMGKDGAFDLDGELPINPSGGVLCTNPISVTALVRVAEAALQVMGRAGERQVKRVKRAVATGMGGSLQIHTATILSDEPR
jgi:acetyl-CoA C-acetyltransferase